LALEFEIYVASFMVISLFVFGGTAGVVLLGVTVTVLSSQLSVGLFWPDIS